jgi:hypothetical protein
VRPAASITALAALTLLLPAAPGYDAWAWLSWGREVAALSLDTAAGPAWKPLPVAVAALLAPLGAAAPELWLLVARAGALAAVALAWSLGRRWGGALAGALAAGGVVLTGGFVRHAAVGDAEPLVVALMLGALALALDGRHRPGLACGALAALLRPETWPFLAAYALWRRREDRVLVAAIAVAVPAVWVVPELLSSGELLRSAERARVPNPGQPATAAVPSLATLGAAAGVVFAPAAVAALAARGRAALPALAGAAWIALVAAMSEAGFSGEPRYLLPGAALIAVSGGPGGARLWSAARRRGAARGREAPRRREAPRQREAPRRREAPRGRGAALPAAAVAALALAAVPLAALRVADVAELGPRLAYQRDLAADLERAIDAAGGRDRILACGRPAVGRYRGTLLAYHLDVPKRIVRADGRPAAVTFRSRLTASAAPSPPAGGAVLAANARWRVAARCR